MGVLISASIIGLVHAVPRSAGIGAWIAPAVWVAGASAVGTIAFLRRRGKGTRGPHPDDGEDDGGSRRPKTPPSPPSGPVSWPDFERDFAEYCARHKRTAHRE